MTCLKKHNYEQREYWDDVYGTDPNDRREWLCDYSSISEFIHMSASKSDRILVIGCGNSSFSHDLYEDGYTNIINIDYSSIVIDQMRRKYPYLQWIQMDMFHLEFPANSFDVVIEKATLDSFMDSVRDPWNIPDESKGKMRTVLSEIVRVLIDHGRFVSITFAQPHFRLPLYIDQGRWSPSVHRIGSEFHYYVYIMDKRLSSDRNQIEKYLIGHKPEQYQFQELHENDDTFLSRISIHELDE